MTRQQQAGSQKAHLMAHKDVGTFERACRGRVASLDTDDFHEFERRGQLLNDRLVALEELLGPDVGERKRPRDLAGAARQGGEARGEERPDVVDSCGRVEVGREETFGVREAIRRVDAVHVVAAAQWGTSGVSFLKADPALGGHH